MSRSAGDRNQQSLQNIQNQQIHQVVRLQQSNPQQQLLSQSAGSPIVIGNTAANSNIAANNDVQRSIFSTVNPLQNSILYSTPPSASTAVTSGNVGRNTNPASTSISTPTSHHDSSSPIAKKRLKLDTDSNTSAEESLSARRERILEHKHQRLKALKER